MVRILRGFESNIRTTILGAIGGGAVGLAAGLLGTNELAQSSQLVSEMYPYFMTAGGLAGMFTGAYIGPFAANAPTLYRMWRDSDRV